MVLDGGLKSKGCMRVEKLGGIELRYSSLSRASL